MSIRPLLNQLKESGIHIEIKDSKLKLNAPEGKLTTALIEKLKSRKQEIIDFLQKNVQSQVDYASIEPAKEKEYYALSSAQKRMYFLQQLDRESSVYNILSLIPIHEHSDLEKLEIGFKKLIHRHESLRTSFEMVENRLVQKIHREVDFNLQFYNGIDDFVRSFDLSRAPLLRAGIIESKTDGRLLAVDMHHIISDGISLEIMKRDFMALYRGEHLFPLRLQYKDYAEWHSNAVRREAYKKQETYWLTEFSGEIPVLEMSADYPRPYSQSFEGSRLFFKISSEKTLLLKNIALENGATPYIMLIAILNVLLAKLSGQEDIVIGIPTSGRNHADLEGIIGMFVNTLALRNYPSGGKTFKAFLSEVTQRTLNAFENQDYQFEDLVEKLAVKRDAARNPLFDVMFIWQNMGKKTAPGMETGTPVYEKNASRFDMTWSGAEVGDRLGFSIEYCTKLFKKETILRFIDYFSRLVSCTLESPELKIKEFEIISGEEKNRILYEFNDTGTQYPGDITIHRMFERQVEKTPGNLAAVYADTHLTYRELNKRSNRWAALLKGKGISGGGIVAIVVERSLETIIGILAILKAGAAYLPIDPEYPEERINYMLADSGARILLTASTVQTGGKEQLNSTCRVSTADPAYVLYTSGSTGKPKGVTIEHRAAVNLLYGLFAGYPMAESGRYLLKTSFLFDVSVSELFGWIPGGAAMVLLAKGGEKDPQKIIDAICREKISHINFVPAMFTVFLDSLNPRDVVKLSSLKYIFLAGEAVLPELVDEFRRLHHDNTGAAVGFCLENLYGPTEGTVYSSRFTISGADISGRIPIGRPLPNVELYILDNHGHLQGIGIAGELCIAGAGLARGYLNNPELTAEKFSRGAAPSLVTSYPLPLTSLYRTGDLARWLPDGNIEFLGRIDNQVKIRGFRIELGEIENQLLNHENIKEAVVSAKENNSNKLLVAYIVPGPGKEIEISGLKDHLSRVLPFYMIPSYFVQMETIPLTPSGKVDRMGLPDPEIKASETYTPPGNEIEEALCKMWSEILGIEKEKISIHDNFFEIGGNSVSLINMVGRIRKELDNEIPLSHIYHNSTITDIARALMSKDFTERPVILLNGERPKKIFGTPSQFGYGLGYMSLARAFEDYSFYLLTFIEDDNRVSRYVDIIKGIQPTGPYVFFGHSSAGLLTYEIALALEKQGCEVSDIIFGDCFVNEHAREMPGEEYIERVRPNIESYLKRLNAEFLIEKVAKKTLKYREYRISVTPLEKIDANVHLILSKDAQPGGIFVEADPHCWDNLTTKPSRIYNGWGDHQHMLMGEALEKNIEIIKSILY